MKPVLLALCLLSPGTLACESDHQLALSGTATVETCSPQATVDCVFSGDVPHPYFAPAVRIPQTVHAAETRGGQRLVDRRVGFDPRIALRPAAA